MRGRMSDRESYAAPVEVGSVMVGGTVSQVIKSNHPQFSTGDFVLGYDSWQAYSISKGETLRKLDPNQACISYALGVTGMPEMTAYFALLDVGQPKTGETEKLRQADCSSQRRSDTIGIIFESIINYVRNSSLCSSSDCDLNDNLATSRLRTSYPY